MNTATTEADTVERDAFVALMCDARDRIMTHLPLIELPTQRDLADAMVDFGFIAAHLHPAMARELIHPCPCAGCSFIFLAELHYEIGAAFGRARRSIEVPAVQVTWEAMRYDDPSWIELPHFTDANSSKQRYAHVAGVVMALFAEMTIGARPRVTSAPEAADFLAACCVGGQQISKRFFHPGGIEA